MKKLVTSEAVTSGHPDKMCDIISDGILDAYLEQDKDSRVACEVMVSKNQIVIVGEISSQGKVDILSLAREIITNIGYDNDDLGFNGKTVKIIVDTNLQSENIARGVNKADIGAGDQGIMYGYATDETDNFMPLVHNLVSGLAKQLDYVRKNKLILGLRPDGKAQVTLEYTDDKVIAKTIVVSIQHNPAKDIDTLREEIINKVIKEVIPEEMLTDATEILINPTGLFVIGGPVADSGLTGRKIMVDTYGGMVPHGGGAFSGKDYTKVDRSAAYYARYVAKNIVASGLARKCLVSVSYAIGVSTPIMVEVGTYNTGIMSDKDILEIVNKVFDFRPSNIIRELDLKNVKYQDTTLYSHFGHIESNWEKLDKVNLLKELYSLVK